MSTSPSSTQRKPLTTRSTLATTRNTTLTARSTAFVPKSTAAKKTASPTSSPPIAEPPTASWSSASSGAVTPPLTASSSVSTTRPTTPPPGTAAASSAAATAPVMGPPVKAMSVADSMAAKSGTVGKWRSARVFISSTFRDMHGERDYLTRTVFPELQERCNKIRVRVTPVDLRWGVTEEDTNAALELCLTEVDNCRPFFIGLLANRYGWVPKSYDVPDAPEFEWVKSVPAGYSITHLEVMHGFLNNPDKSAAAFYFRDPTFQANVPSEALRDFESENFNAKEQLKNLKASIKRAGATVYEDYPCHWKGVVDGKPMVGGLEAFGQHVTEFLWNSFQKHFPQELVDMTPIEAARAEHENFIETHSRSFVGRRKLLDDLKNYADGVSTTPLVVIGEPGGGKTSLVAAFAREYMSSRGERLCAVIPHFIGGAAGSTDIRRTLSRLCSELASPLKYKEEIPEDFQDLKALFSKLICDTAKDYIGQIVLIIDALNQLDTSYNAHSLDWLPNTFPTNVKIVVSTLRGKCLEVLQRRETTELTVGPLTRDEQKEIVRKTLWEYRKKLDERPENDQMGLLLKKKDASKPLYLIVACEELRVFGVFEQLSKKIQSFSETVALLFQDVLERLESDHGRELVSNALSLLKASRSGLLEKEMLAALGYAGSMATPIFGPLKQNLSQNTWAKLYRSLKSYLLPVGDSGEGTLNFFHQQLSFAVEARYFDGASGKLMKEKINRRLADYFMDVADPHHNMSWVGEGRGMSEVVYHILFGRMWGELHKTLCDLCFIENKCRAGLAYELVTDYLRSCTDTEPENSEDIISKQACDLAKEFSAKCTELSRQVKEFLGFVQGRVHVLTKKPHEAFALAANLPSKSAPALTAAERWNRRVETRAWLEWTNKPQEANPCVLTFAGHNMVVREVHFNPTNPLRAVSCSDDTNVFIWNTKTGEEEKALKGHKMSVLSCCWNFDGSLIATGSWDKTVKIWNATTGVEVITIASHKGVINRVAFSSKNQLLTASADKTCKVFDSTGNELATLKEHTASCTGCSWSPDGSMIATCSQDRVVKLWDGTTYACIRTLSGHVKSINNVKFSPDGKQVISAGDDRDAIIWNVATGGVVVRLSEHKDGVCDVDFLPSGDKVVTTSHDNMVRIFDSSSGDLIYTLLGHTGSVFYCCAGPDNVHVATCSFDRSAKIWDLSLAKAGICGHTARILALAYNNNGSLLVTASRDKTLKVWDVAKCTELLTLAGHTSNVFSCAFSPNGETVLSGSRDHTMKLWDTKTGICTRTLDGHTNIVYGCCFSPDGKTIVSASADKLIKLWDVETGVQKATLYGHRSDVLCVAWSPDGNKIVTGSEDFTLKLWHALSHRKLATFCGHTKGVHCCTFSPDSTKVLSGSDDNQIREWDARNARCLSVISIHTSTVKGLRYSLDGTKFVSASTDSSVIIFDTRTKIPLVTYTCLSRLTCISVPVVPLLRSGIATGDGSGALYLLTPVGIEF
ncbi:telomerase protein component 1 [Pelomyxa schiedti]|nr:telomerase protein component 1 [Pelomyxa schiedti]